MSYSRSLVAWIPDSATIYNDLVSYAELVPGVYLTNNTYWQGMDTHWDPESERTSFFTGATWSRFTANNWTMAFGTVALYIAMIPILKAYIAKHGKWNVRNFAFYWNASLSIFSWLGVFATVPPLVSSFFEHGLYFTCCAPPYTYAYGWPGLFMALFVYSKYAELIDTVILLLAGKPVIALQWWHHSTVLLYCAHSYSVGIATGAWFACMNYSVHSVMYGYFAAMGTKYRKACSPYAIYITLAQLLQMLVGMFVTLKAVFYQAAGEECLVNKTNSVLGLLMYASYFALFFKLFVDNYCLKKRSIESSTTTTAKKLSVAKLLKSTSQKLTRQLSMPAVDFDDAEGDTENSSASEHLTMSSSGERDQSSKKEN